MKLSKLKITDVPGSSKPNKSHGRIVSKFSKKKFPNEGKLNLHIKGTHKLQGKRPYSTNNTGELNWRR